MSSRLVRSSIRSQSSLSAGTDSVADMNVLDRQLENTRINWLQQHHSNGFTHHDHHPASYMSELVAMFGKTTPSDEPDDTLAWHSSPLPNYVGDTDLAVRLPRADQVGADCQKVVKQIAPTPSPGNEVVVLDDESDDDDWFFLDDFESYSNKASSSKRKAAFLSGEECSEERTKDAAMEPMGCKTPSHENAADALKASEINNKLGNVRGRAKCAAGRCDSQRLSSAEKKRRQKILDKLQCLRNMVPWGNKEKKSRTDVLDDTILYLKYLENQYLYFQLMLAEPGSPNPSNVVTKPKKFIANKKSAAAYDASPLATDAFTVDVNFARPAEQITAQLPFAPQLATWGYSTSALTIPAEQYFHGPSSFAQELPITYDPKTLSTLHQSVSRR